MPEGPEICITAQYLSTKIKGRIMSKLEVLSGKYMKKNIKGIDLLSDNLIIKSIKAKGKMLWFELCNQHDTSKCFYLISNFGMTGEWSFGVYEKSKPRLKMTIKNKDNDKIYNLYYYDDRNFGNVEISDSKDVLNKRINSLAPDFLQTDFSAGDFRGWIKSFLNKSKKRGDVKLGKLLMIQDNDKGIGSGIGNYLSAEIMYNAKLSPHRTIGSLTDSEINSLCNSIKYIMKLSYYNNKTGYMSNFGKFTEVHRKGIDDGRFPNFHDSIKFKEGDEFEFKVYRMKTDSHGNEIIADSSINNDRTSWWVPNVQI